MRYRLWLVAGVWETGERMSLMITSFMVTLEADGKAIAQPYSEGILRMRGRTDYG